VIEQYPRLGEAYALYDQCRTRQLVIHEVPKQGGKQTEIRMVNVPSGYICLPYSGGLLDQPSFIVDSFFQFMLAERTVAMKQLTK
jgi:hypothetical protein